jgi:PAS domain S-box-containing protein
MQERIKSGISSDDNSVVRGDAGFYAPRTVTTSATDQEPQLTLGAAAFVEPWSLVDSTVDDAPSRAGSEPSRNGVPDETRLLREMTAAIAGATTVRDAIELVLREICALTGWALGQAWTRNGGSYLECSPAWCAASEDLRPFRERSASMTFEPGVGLPGRVLSTGRPIWVKDLRSHDLPRGPFALEVGIVAGIGVPVLAGREVVAVLEFLMTDSRPADESLLALVSTTAAQLGSLVQRKQAEEELRASEECFRLLVESVDDCAICRLDPSGRITSWNAGARRILGYESEEIVGYNVARFYPPEAVRNGDPESHLEQARETGRYEHSDWRVRSDGLRFLADAVIVPLRTAGGRLQGFSHLIRDHTAQLQAEEELLRLQAVVECCDDAIVSLTPDRGIIATWNGGAERLFGYTAREVIGRCVGLLLPRDQAQEQLGQIDAELREGRVTRRELAAVRKNGGRVDISVTFSPITGSTGETVGVSAVARDVGHSKCQQRHMKRAFGTYLDQGVAEQIIQGNGSALTAVEALATIMFVDIRDFTALTEELDPRDAVSTLNHFFEVAVPVIVEHGGHVDKFIGDGLLAVFGLESDDHGDADRALRAALELARLVSRDFEGAIEVGIGLHTGKVVAGNVGGGGRLDFTVIGDVVNTAARIEAATRSTGDPILISEAMRMQLREAELKAIERPSVPIKGKRESMRLFAPVMPVPLASAQIDDEES